MRKIATFTLLAAAAILPTIAQAQTHELRHDRREVREERRELDRAIRHGDRDDIREERREYHDAKREYRQDWRDYRRDHREVYARGNWRAPFRYQRWNSGVVLRPSYYAPRYYVNDYGRYRLPRPAANLRWVRHYDDVLLVNVRTGRIVEVHRDFFW